MAEPHIDVAVHLLEPLAQLTDVIGHVLDPPGQVAHLLLEPIHPDLKIDGDIAALTRGRRLVAAVAVDLPLEHAEVAFDAVEALLRRRVLGGGILAVSHRHRRHRKHHQQ